MGQSQARWWRAAAIGAALAIMATMAGCSAADDGAPVTLTETVTVTPGAGGGSVTAAGEAVDTGSSGAPDSSGAPITVVQPNTTNSADTTGADPTSSEAPAFETGRPPPANSPDDTQDIDDPFQTGTSAATTPTSSTPPPDTAETRAAARMVAAQCPTLLSASDIARALGTSLPAPTIRVQDVANPDNKMTARTKCYYGTDDIGAARPLVLAVASFTDPDAAAQQRDVTLASEKAAGAKVSNSDVGSGDGEIKIMVRDGGLAVTQVGAATVSIAIGQGVVTDSALRSALTLLTRSVTSHVR